MISINAQSKVYIATEPIDFRNGILGLKTNVKEYHRKSPDSGTFYLFRNKKMNAIKVLVYDGQGFWLMLKRLSRGRFPWWPENIGRGIESDHKKLQLIINAANEVSFSDDWKKLY